MAGVVKKVGVSGKEACAALEITRETLSQWEQKGWLVRHPDKSIDLDATRERVDMLRSPFVGGKSDRGAGPKPVLSAGAGAGADVKASLRGGMVTAVRTQVDSDDDRSFDGYIDIVEAKRRETVAKAEKAEIEVAKLRGELIPVSRALSVYADVATKIKVNVESIPNRCVELLVGQTDPAVVRHILEVEIERALAAVTEGAPHVDG